MEIVTLEEMLESLRENMESELSSQGLATWSIGASGEDFAELLSSYPLSDLEDLRNEITEGGRVEVVVDLSTAITEYLDSLIEEKQASALDEEELEDDDDYLDEDEEEEEFDPEE